LKVHGRHEETATGVSESKEAALADGSQCAAKLSEGGEENSSGRGKEEED